MRALRFILIAALVFSSAMWVPQSAVNADVKQGAPGKEEPPADQPRKVVVTSPLAKDVVVTQQYVGFLRSQRHINIRSLLDGYLEAVPVREGQAVKKGDVLFKVLPILYKARLDAELAEVQIAQLEFAKTKELFDKKGASETEVKLSEAKLAKAQAKAKLAAAELNFTTIRAPFDGVLGRLESQEGSLIKEADILTTLSDNSVMWVNFHVPEARYLEYARAGLGKRKDPSRLELVGSRIELMLADGSTFAHDAGSTVTVEGRFSSETGNIPFRADFPNPDHLLRHGQTGTVLIRKTVKNAIVIPQRATFEVLDKHYVYVVGKDNVVHQREIVVQHELEDVFVISKGLDGNDRIVLDGVQQVSDGEKTEYEFRKPEEAISGAKKKK